MTKEELEKEAEQYAIENWEHYEEGQTDYKALKQAYLDSAEPREKRIVELEKENAELKNGCGMCYRKDKEKLTKAKEIIKKFSEFVNNEIEYDPEHPQEHTDLWNKLCEESEEFLKENEK